MTKPSEEPLEQLEEDIQDVRRQVAHDNHEDEKKFIEEQPQPGPVDNTIVPPG
jgi:hypothetical protein